jgi:eukaryotic-like serine/threonine-protein kinase
VSLTPGTRLGPFEISAQIGVGGMGEVYRATDMNLARQVAIKVLPESMAADGERLARFEREAKTLAALNHPNIAAIYGLERSGGPIALVMEFIDGPTLADRIAEGPMPVDEALAVAKQIADAVEAAHEQGIIHRDLKPANIKLRADGTVKVLDFGLAKMAEPVGSVASHVSVSPTITTPAMTQLGVILGTAAYMSPEQAKGKAADKRSDIWAFGCVLYEMLAGVRAFAADDVADTLAAVLRADPDWARLPANTPGSIRRLLFRSLQKDRNNRLAHIADARIEIIEAREPSSVGITGAYPNARTSARRLIFVSTACVIAAVALTAAVSWLVLRDAGPQIPSQSVRFAITPSADLSLFRAGFDRDLVISPDDTFMVYRSGIGQSISGLALRMLNRLESQQLSGVTNNIAAPFVSPDSRWIGFFAQDGLKKVPVAGGPPITITRFTGVPRGATWGPDDSIIFATSDPATGLLSVPAGGGDPKPLTNADPAHTVDHFFPSVLPGGKGVLYTVRRNLGPLDAENNEVAVLDFKTGQSKILIRGGSNAEYAESGHLVYVAAGTVMAAPFDLDQFAVTGDAVPLVEQVEVKGGGIGNFALSKRGTFVYLPSGARAEPRRSLVWVDRQGREEPINVPPRAYSVPRLSPDGRRVALQAADEENDIWIWDLMRQTLTRLTFGAAIDTLPVWTPDGTRIIFNSTRNGVQNLYWQAADGTGSVERLTTSNNPQFPFSITPDGKRVLLGEVAPSTAADVRQVFIDGERKTEPLVQTSFSEYSPKISPDGRWLAYQSSESNQFQIYVRPFPAVDSGRWQVSAAGGTRPVWAPNSRELFYLDNGNVLTTVPIQTSGSALNAGNPVRVLNKPYYSGFNLGAYDVSPDGRRFLMIKDADAGQGATAPQIVVIQNWTEDLKRRFKTF